MQGRNCIVCCCAAGLGAIVEAIHSTRPKSHGCRGGGVSSTTTTAVKLAIIQSSFGSAWGYGPEKLRGTVRIYHHRNACILPSCEDQLYFRSFSSAPFHLFFSSVGWPNVGSKRSSQV